MTRTARSFHVADLSPQGELRDVTSYDYATLERLPGCAEMMFAFSNQLYRGDGAHTFELAPLGGIASLRFRWSATAPTAGVATIRADEQLASLSILATGVNPSADSITLAAFQQRLTQELHDTGFEPAFGLLELDRRPLVATVPFHSPSDEAARLIVALADRCFAASYFRFHQLA